MALTHPDPLDFDAALRDLRALARTGRLDRPEQRRRCRTLAEQAKDGYRAAVATGAPLREQIRWARRVVNLLVGNVWWTSLSPSGHLTPGRLFAHEQRQFTAAMAPHDVADHPVMRRSDRYRGVSPARMAAIRPGTR